MGKFSATSKLGLSVDIKILLAVDFLQDQKHSHAFQTNMRKLQNRVVASNTKVLGDRTEFLEDLGSNFVPFPLGMFYENSLVGAMLIHIDTNAFTSNVSNIFFCTGLSLELKGRVLIVISEWLKARFPTYSIMLDFSLSDGEIAQTALKSGYKEINGRASNLDRYEYVAPISPLIDSILEVYTSPGFFFGTDTGGVENLIEFFLRLENDGLFVIQGAGSHVANYFRINHQNEMVGKLYTDRPLIYSTGTNPGPLNRILSCYKSVASPRICILDHWINYDTRIDSGVEGFDTKFVTTNELAYDIALKYLPRSQIALTPDYRFLRLQTLMSVDVRRSEKCVLVILEPERDSIEGLASITPEQQKQAVKAAVSIASSMGISKVLIRLHPKMRIQTIFFVAISKGVSVEYSKNLRIEDDLISSSAIVGLSSSVLYFSAKLGLPTFTVIDFSKDSWIGRFGKIMSIK